MANNEINSKKYISFSIARGDIDEVFRIINTFFIEALHLKRIPVIGKFTVPPSQGTKRRYFCFSDYIDLSKGTVRKQDSVDRIITDHQNWIAEEDLKLETYPADRVCQIKNNIISKEMNEKYDVIIRKDLTKKYVYNYYRQQPSDVFLDFPYSEKVNKLTDIVLDAFGTTRKEAWATICHFLDKVGTMRSCFDEGTRARGSSISLQRRGHYACLRMPNAKEMRNAQHPVQLFSSAESQIKEVLSYAISKKSRIYIASDIPNPHYFDFLKKDYEVYRYHDFPQLKQLISDNDGNSTDSVMLYLVEKNIMKYATVKILPPNHGSTISHLNEVYNISILKNPLLGTTKSSAEN